MKEPEEAEKGAAKRSGTSLLTGCSSHTRCEEAKMRGLKKSTVCQQGPHARK